MDDLPTYTAFAGELKTERGDTELNVAFGKFG